MARSDAVWGIDIGQCALKALQCRPHEDSNRVVAAAFDYIEYPKILSQPDADPAELVGEALKQFLSRNSVRGDRVVISVSGQSGLARFIKLPPVEAKKIPDIVKYEAKQQIPFALEDVVWDFQRMAGGTEIEGFAMETEVGLFAMKRDQVFRALKPFRDAEIEVDVIQLTPLALYNFVAFDQMTHLPPPEEYDPESPPESVVLVSLGTDTTDLVVTNGFRIWQRSIPIGGNHFTKALTKELKLTFASAEHMKRNAAQAEDPKALFQAMRPVFNDLLTEVQRSIGYFTNLDRRAKIGRALALGNAMKLPGLQRYLAQNLGFDLARVESFRGLSGAAVVDAPAFKENVLAFGVCYGLALQGLRDTKIKTNLLPREIALDRMIRAKKPWAVGAAASLLLGFSVSFFSYWRAANSVAMVDWHGNGYFKPAVEKAKTVATTASTYKSDFEKAKGDYAKTVEIGDGFIQNAAGRDMVLKVWKAINLCLPYDVGERPKEITKRNELNIESLECFYVDDLSAWYAGLNANDKKEAESAAEAPAPVNADAKPEPPAPANAAPPPADATAPANAAPPPADATAPANAAAQEAPPKGPGWVFQLKGHHYHNDPKDTNQGYVFVRDSFLKKLRLDEVPLPPEEQPPGGPTTYPVRKLGISAPVLINPENIKRTYKLRVEDLDAEGENAGAGANQNAGAGMNQGEGAGGFKMIDAPRFDFVIQFCWQVPAPNAPALAEANLSRSKPQDDSEVVAGKDAGSNAIERPAATPAEPAADGEGDKAADEPASTVGEASEAMDDPAGGDAGGEATAEEAPVGESEADEMEPTENKPEDDEPEASDPGNTEPDSTEPEDAKPDAK